LLCLIGNFQTDGNLPPGMHTATFSEVVERFGTNEHRRKLLAGMEEALVALKKAGCLAVYLDGSFVTTKERPGDYDCCWEPMYVNPELLDNILRDCSRAGIARQKFRYGGEFYPAPTIEKNSQRSFKSFFQTDAETGKQKGIVVIDISELQ
jgi:Family of unknown function (DUF6932)